MIPHGPQEDAGSAGRGVAHELDRLAGADRIRRDAHEQVGSHAPIVASGPGPRGGHGPGRRVTGAAVGWPHEPNARGATVRRRPATSGTTSRCSEIQRVLMSSSGPVNWELARQVGIASASWGTRTRPSEEDRRGFDEAVRVAELQVAGFTGLEAPSDIPKVEAVRRGQWVQANIEGLRALLEPAAKIGDAIATAQREAVPEQAQAGVAQVLGQLSPLLLGAQVGTVLGTLAQQVLGQYDIAVPRPDGAGALLFVVPNIARFEEKVGLDPTDFRTWIAIHEVTHRFEFARPWALTRFRELIDDFTSTLTRRPGACSNGSRRSIPPTRRACRRCSPVRTRCSAR